MSIKSKLTIPNFTAIPLLVLLFAGRVLAQSAPSSPDHPWHFPGEQQMEDDAKHFRESRSSIEPDRVYSLAELVDLAETHNPETRVAWERARAQVAALVADLMMVPRNRIFRAGVERRAGLALRLLTGRPSDTCTDDGQFGNCECPASVSQGIH